MIMTSCDTGQHDAAPLEGCVSIVELTIILAASGYHTILKKDGVVMDRKGFETRHQVIDWATAIMDWVGQNLYIRLYLREGHSRQSLLDLASTLSRQGILVGINNLSFSCRLSTGHLK